MFYLLPALGLGFLLVERLWPARTLPRVRAWWPRVILVNLLHLGCVILSGWLWERHLKGLSLFHLSGHVNDYVAGTVAYLIASVAYYWWHRLRHDSKFFWRLCHQLHHSPQRLEVVMAFYKHPVEIICNSLLSSSITYLLLGCSIEAAAFYALLAGLAEFFYHWNIKTPHWLGYLIQRPEAHRIHHRRAHHTHNYGDFPILDMLFGTFDNPKNFNVECGFDDWREDRMEDMLAFRDVHDPKVEQQAPLHFLPTCIGCGKRWACHAAKSAAATPTAHPEEKQAGPFAAPEQS